MNQTSDVKYSLTFLLADSSHQQKPSFPQRKKREGEGFDVDLKTDETIFHSSKKPKNEKTLSEREIMEIEERDFLFQKIQKFEFEKLPLFNREFPLIPNDLRRLVLYKEFNKNLQKLYLEELLQTDDLLSELHKIRSSQVNPFTLSLESRQKDVFLAYKTAEAIRHRFNKEIVFYSKTDPFRDLANPKYPVIKD